MKKRGFTLAEVLIAMALIGVISALTIPTFVSNSRNKANATKLAATVSAVENAFTSMISAEGASDLTETEILDENGNVTNLEKKLGNYLKITSTGIYNLSHRTIDGSVPNRTVKEFYLTKNGSYIGFNYNQYKAIKPDALEDLTNALTGFVADVVVDVNGISKPNIWGRDAFLFVLGDDGALYPAGGKEYSILTGNSNNLWYKSSQYSCTESVKTEGCTARLVQNDYEVDY